MYWLRKPSLLSKSEWTGLDLLINSNPAISHWINISFLKCFLLCHGGSGAVEMFSHWFLEVSIFGVKFVCLLFCWPASTYVDSERTFWQMMAHITLESELAKALWGHNGLFGLAACFSNSWKLIHTNSDHCEGLKQQIKYNFKLTLSQFIGWSGSSPIETSRR